MEELWVTAHLLLRVSLWTGGGNSGSYIPLSFCANLLVRQHYSDITARDLVDCQSTSSAWYAMTVSNRRPQTCKDCALPTELIAYMAPRLGFEPKSRTFVGWHTIHCANTVYLGFIEVPILHQYNLLFLTSCEVTYRSHTTYE